MTENENLVDEEMVEYAEAAYILYTSYESAQQTNIRLIQQVEELQSHAQAIQDGLDQEMFA